MIRDWLKSSFLVFTSLWSLVAVGAESRPNILLIISDDQAWTDYSFMGHPHLDTPRLDQLAAESTTYTRGYVTSPLCRASLASIVTGLPTHRHGITGNDPAMPDGSKGRPSRKKPQFRELHETLYRQFAEAPNIAELLQEAGYATMQTGKWWESDPKRFGFDTAMTHGDPARGGRHGDAGLEISRRGIEPIRAFLDGATSGESAQPFFIWHAPFLPHAPHTPPEELLKKYLPVAPSRPVALYWAMCEWFDQTCGELLDEIASRELKQETLIVYVVDNGWIQDPDQAHGHGPRSKRTPYEGGVRTPIMVRWPGQVAPRRDMSTLVSTIDIAPTILQAAGVDVPDSMSGIDLGNRESLRERNAAYGSAHPHDIADVSNSTAEVTARYIVAGPWKLIAFHDSPDRSELYHLEVDPHEEVNLAKSRPEVVARLRRQLDAWWTPQ